MWTSMMQGVYMINNFFLKFTNDNIVVINMIDINMDYL